MTPGDPNEKYSAKTCVAVDIAQQVLSQRVLCIEPISATEATCQIR